MSITPIITALESDVFLALYSTWLDLSDAVKDAHIYNASLYIQTQYDCLKVDGEDIDWTDTSTIPDEIKNACALYAMADFAENLFGDVATADTRKTTSELVKAGAVTVEEEFASSGTNESGLSSSFVKPDLLMSFYCTKSSGSIGGSSTLLRN